MIYSMLVLFTCCWGSNLSIQAEVGKLNEDLLQPSEIRYKVWSFSVRHLIYIAYWKGFIFGVKLSVVVLYIQFNGWDIIFSFARPWLYPMSIHFNSSSIKGLLGENIINGFSSCKNLIWNLFQQNRRNR